MQTAWPGEGLATLEGWIVWSPLHTLNGLLRVTYYGNGKGFGCGGERDRTFFPGSSSPTNMAPQGAFSTQPPGRFLEDLFNAELDTDSSGSTTETLSRLRRSGALVENSSRLVSEIALSTIIPDTYLEPDPPL